MKFSVKEISMENFIFCVVFKTGWISGFFRFLPQKKYLSEKDVFLHLQNS